MDTMWALGVTVSVNTVLVLHHEEAWVFEFYIEIVNISLFIIYFLIYWPEKKFYEFTFVVMSCYECTPLKKHTKSKKNISFVFLLS